MTSAITRNDSSVSELLTLSRLLAFDGLTCALMGILLTSAASGLAGLLALPEQLLLYAGIALFPCALLMFFAASRSSATKALARVIIALNGAWVLGSVLVAFVFYTPTTLGLVFVLVQASVVAVIAELEALGLRREKVGAGG